MSRPSRAELIAGLRRLYRMLTEGLSNLHVPVFARIKMWRERNRVEDLLIRDEGKDETPDIGHRDPPE